MKQSKIKALTILIEKLRAKLKPLLKQRRILQNNILRDEWVKKKKSKN